MAVRPRVLVVDDDPTNRELIVSCLSAAYEVAEAPDGAVALERLQGEAFDLVLLDVTMPRLDGLETCRRLRRRQAGAFLPVVLLTALSGQEDRNAGLAAGADDFLSKPIDTRELALRVKGLLRLREQDQRIREQMAELQAKNALIQAQLEQLQKLGELKDDLFSLIVHDLRNPLTGLVGYLEVLDAGLCDSAHACLRSHARRAQEAAGKVRALLEEVLEVRSLEAGAVPVRRASCRFREVAEQAAQSLGGAAAARGIALVVEGDADLAGSIDPGLIRRALENLLANAIRYSPDGGRVGVTIRADGDRHLLEVEDEGPGLGESGKLKLFTKFATDSPPSAGRKGFGLGLYLVKLVAVAHGGAPVVRDRPGGGVAFGLCLPREAGA